MQFSVGTMPHAQTMRAIELFGTQVAPVIRRETASVAPDGGGRAHLLGTWRARWRYICVRILPVTLRASVVALALSSIAAQAQPVASIGQPPIWQPYGAAGLAWDNTRRGPSGTAALGVLRYVTNPVTGLLAGAGELYVNTGGAFGGGGARVLTRSPALSLAVGFDINAGRGRAPRREFIMSYQSAIRRGGLLGRGTMLRLDWLPGRSRTFAAGISAPLLQPLAGRTRPREIGARLPAPSDGPAWASGPLQADADAELARVASAAMLVRRYSRTWSDADVRALQSAAGGFPAVTAAYHDALARALGAAAGNRALGESISARAREGLLANVLLPYDSLFGQVRANPASIRGLSAVAQERFARWVRDSSRVSSGAQPAVLIAHARWLQVVERVHASLLDELGDSRMVWMPLGLALRPEQYDEQVEVDSLIARAVGRPFTDENAFTYLRSSDLPLEIARSVYAARKYHVLWTHDFTGRRDRKGSVDNISYEMVADVYLPALTEAVKRYDQVGRIPAYLIMLDQYFYEPRIGRLWMTILEDPLNADMGLPGDNAARVAHMRDRQEELRAAVAASARLQRDAVASGGADWLRRTVRVHVNITQQSDFSFRSRRIIPPLPFTPDNVMRDHRKLVLYDLDEANPYGGAMMLMGVGIGEHYASATWEDRGYRLRGPAALEARDALRRLLLSQGFSPADIPAPLRAVQDTRRAEQRMNTGDYVGRALQVHNEVGFGRKQSSVVRAMLYDLSQPGSLIIAPDPLWLSAEWAAMLTAAAARGARVQVIAPAAANAPSPEAPLMALAHEVMSRLVVLGGTLAPQLKEAGGALRVGMFAAKANANDATGRRREVREGLIRAPWIHQLIPFDAQTLRVLDRAEAVVAVDGRDATALARDEVPRAPQLHQKTQLFARPGAIAVLVHQPGWEDVLARAMEVQSRQTARFAEQLGYESPPLDSAATRAVDGILRGYEHSIPEAERRRVSFYFTEGTHNQDPRGMVSDGEATMVTSGFQGAAGLVDLFYLMARSTWISSQAELDRFIPPPSRMMKRLAGVLRPTL